MGLVQQSLTGISNYAPLDPVPGHSADDNQIYFQFCSNLADYLGGLALPQMYMRHINTAGTGDPVCLRCVVEILERGDKVGIGTVSSGQISGQFGDLLVKFEVRLFGCGGIDRRQDTAVFPVLEVFYHQHPAG